MTKQEQASKILDAIEDLQNEPNTVQEVDLLQKAYDAVEAFNGLQDGR